MADRGPAKENKRRLLFVMGQFYNGGAEQALLNLLAVLPRDAFEVDFLVMNQLRWPGLESLLDRVPGWVRVISPAAGRPGVLNVALEACQRVCYALFGRTPFAPGFKSLGAGEYGWAFSYGEWLPPHFVARHAKARRKAAWMHTDLDKADFFKGGRYFKWDGAFAAYLFPSAEAMAGSCAAYAPLRGKSHCVHNVVDAAGVRAKAQEPLPEDDAALFGRGLPVIVTVANLRPEKNHVRQLAAMALLKQQGVEFIWLNVGGWKDAAMPAGLREKAREHGLEDRFLLLGPKENPYPYMAAADAVAVFSDFESWSMVISEAKALGRPVLATRTSGAAQQLADGVDALLCGFSAEEMAGVLGRFLGDEALRRALRAGAEKTGPLYADAAEFVAFLNGFEDTARQAGAGAPGEGAKG